MVGDRGGAVRAGVVQAGVVHQCMRIRMVDSCTPDMVDGVDGVTPDGVDGVAPDGVDGVMPDGVALVEAWSWWFQAPVSGVTAATDTRITVKVVTVKLDTGGSSNSVCENLSLTAAQNSVK